MSKGKKIALGIVIFMGLIVLALAIAVPMLFDVDRYRPQVVARLQEETGKPAQIGHLALTVFPTVSIRIDNFKLGNPPGFPQSQFVEVQRVYAVVDGGALWNRQVIIKSLELDNPSINLLSDSRGHWNFENPTKAPAAKKTANEEKPLFTLGVISSVTMKGGRVTVADLASPGKAGPAYVEGRGLSADLQQVDLNALTASGPPSHPANVYAGGLSILGATPIYAAPPAGEAVAQGTLRADSIRFQQMTATSLKSKMRLYSKQVLLDDLTFDFCSGRAVGDFSLNFGGENLRYATNAKLAGIDMAKVLEAFPDYRGKLTGKMDGNAKISGEVVKSSDPLAGVRGTGQVTIRNGQLPSLQLNKNLMLLARFSNLGPASGDPSSFSSLAADFNIVDQKITSSKISLVGNGVNIDGSGVLGTVGAGSLDYQGVASLAAGANAVTNLVAGLTGAKMENGKLTLPFGLNGTFATPKFLLKGVTRTGQIGALQNALTGVQGQQTGTQTGQQQQPADLIKGVAGLFKKKKASTDQQQTTPPPQQ